MSVRVEVWGEFACFSRPELKTERVSYDVITPSAARGILESVYWHPGLKWTIDRIHVMHPIQTERQSESGGIRMMCMKRNEVKSKISANNVRTVMTGKTGELYLDTAAERNQRTSLILRDVRYVIEAHFEIGVGANPGDNPGKVQDIVKRRLKKGQCFQQPYLGCREFPACFREWEGGAPETVPLTKDLGYMLYDMDYSAGEIRPRFFRARLKNGVMDLRECEVIM